MTVSQKTALSLLVSVVFFAVFTVLAYTGLFDLVEARFYNPSITSSLTKEIKNDAVFVDRFFETNKASFFSTLENDSVRRSFLPSKSAEDIFERSRIYGSLLENTAGLQWIRFIDADGVRLHYSSRPEDILHRDELSIAYKNFPETEAGISYGDIAAPDQGRTELVFDEAANRFLFAFPFYDSFDIFRGTALFAVSIRAMEESLVRENRFKIGETITVIASPPGLVFGIPHGAERDFCQKISSIWNGERLSLSFFDSPDTGASLVLVPERTPGGIVLGRLVEEALFVFPRPMKVILLLSVFLTVYLTVFLVLNLRQDPVTIVRNRLKCLQVSLIEQYYERKGDIDWGRWSKELEQRREEIRGELKQGLGAGSLKKDKDGKNEIDILIDKSWDELPGILNGGRGESGINEEKLEAIINKAISASVSGAAVKKEASYPAAVKVPAQSLPEAETEAFGELTEVVEDAEPVELIEELEPVEEPSELVEEIEEFAELEELEEIPAEEDSPGAGSAGSGGAETDLSKLISKIEFSSSTESDDETTIAGDLEVVSPFSSMSFDFNGEDNKEHAPSAFTDGGQDADELKKKPK